jgi:hypothetical protein
MACTSCASKEMARAPGGERSAGACAALLGSWIEVEPVDGTTIDEAESDKVRVVHPGTRLEFERGRLTVATAVERLDSRVVFEQGTNGRCLLRARDSLGRPLEVDVSFVSERLMRLRNVLEPKSPDSLFERR